MEEHGTVNAEVAGSIPASTAIYHDDCLIRLKAFKENSIDSLVTDPPAGISFMGKEWDKGNNFIPAMSEIFKECLRVMKPGAHGLVWALPRTSHWTATALEQAGFEIRDVVTHLFGSGFPKSHDISKSIDKAAGVERIVIGEKVRADGKIAGLIKPMNSGSFNATQEREGNVLMETAPATEEAKHWQGWGTALKPASEHWILIRKPCSEKTVAQNVLKWGCGGINIDGCRIEGDYKNQGGGSFATGKFANSNASNTDKDGLEYIQGKQTQGRFPANLVLDEVAAEMLDEQSGECKSAGTYLGNKNSGPGIFGGGKTKEKNAFAGETGGASRFFYCAKASKKDRNEGNNHPTVKSTKLMEYLITLVTPPNGVVLDPFMGSGSTGKAAIKLGFKFIGIEREKEYFEIAVKRCKIQS